MLNKVTMLTVRDSADFDRIEFRGIFAKRSDAIAEYERIEAEYQETADPLFADSYRGELQDFAVHM